MPATHRPYCNIAWSCAQDAALPWNHRCAMIEWYLQRIGRGYAMQPELNREQALTLLKKYNHEPFHLKHALTVEGVMRWYAVELGFGEEADFWATAGLLHDIDFVHINSQSVVTF